MTLADELLYTTVNLTGLQQGAAIGSGTGFFWLIPFGDDRGAISIVTNRHVVEGCDQLIAVCHNANPDQTGPSGTFSNQLLNLSRSSVIPHPDPNVDLCGIHFGPVLNEAAAAGAPLFHKSVQARDVPMDAVWSRFDSIEDVFMVGYPRGIYDTHNNLPIVRRGITATPLGRRFEGRDEFMVDMACFPGSSGSPVFMMSTSHIDREARAHVIGGRFFFLGVLYGGPIITNEGQIVLSQQPRVQVAAMMHLGQVIRSSALLTLEEELRRHV
jgi:hypothetical protein